MKYFLAMLLALSACRSPESIQPTQQKPPTRPWDLNDVSVLLPYPKASELPQMLQTPSAGAAGELLPASWLEKVPSPLSINEDPSVALKQLRVIAFRIDPCFLEAGSKTCRPMVRMSWQPLIETGGALRTVDAALHSFYDLSPQDFTALTDKLWELRGGHEELLTKAPLGPHPIISKEGLGGAHWTALRELLLTYCGERSLTRMTVMQLGGRANVWIFSGVEKSPKSGKVLPIRIASLLGGTVQTIAIHMQPPTEFEGGLFGANILEEERINPFEQPEMNALLKGSMKLDLKQQETKEMLSRVLDSTQTLEIPSEKSTSENVDCASCHIAQSVRTWINKRSPESKSKLADFTDESFNLKNQIAFPGATNQLRAFGYFQDKPVISQRVINESAIVAEQMRQR
jgi:hypothetical protein